MVKKPSGKKQERNLEFAYILAHQILAPLTAFKGYFDGLLRNEYGKLPVQAKRTLRKGKNINAKLLRLVESLMDLAKLEAGKFKLKRKRADLVRLISEIIQELKPEAKAKKIHIFWQRPMGKFICEMDRLKIKAVLINLVDNAIRYNRPGGKIQVGLSDYKNFVEVAIKDTGRGLKRGEKKRVFDKFARGDKTEFFHEHGLGLGLYLAKLVIEAHKGGIGAKSAGLSKGSTFWLRLPKKA